VTTPYRDQTLTCPACKQALRAYETRFLCDACDGMFVELADLRHALEDLTGIEPVIQMVDDRPGNRNCPKCALGLTRCHIRVVFEEEVAKPRPELDRCDDHGIWFDKDELANVFQKAYAKVGHRGGAGRGVVSGSVTTSSRWRGGQNGVPDWWNC
jgi:hypothetical protein